MPTDTWTTMWSQYVWDSIGKGHFSWSDTQRIQNERIRIAMTGGGPRASHTGTTQKPGYKVNKPREVVCREFNTSRGCMHGATHEEGGVRFKHLCSYCDSVNKYCPGHNIIGCERKLRHHENDERYRAHRDNFPPMHPFQMPMHQQPQMQPRYRAPQAPFTYPKKRVDGARAPRQEGEGAPSTHHAEQPEKPRAPPDVNKAACSDVTAPNKGQTTGHAPISDSHVTHETTNGKQHGYLGQHGEQGQQTAAQTVMKEGIKLHTSDSQPEGSTAQRQHTAAPPGSMTDSTIQGKQPDFYRIRTMCEKGRNPGIDTRPFIFAPHRKACWPTMNCAPTLEGLGEIYAKVKDTGIPNILGARCTLPSQLNIPKWEEYSTEMGEYADVIDFVKYGFPLGYLGPVSDTRDTPNHPSAEDFPEQIDRFIDKEQKMGGLIGLFEQPPFTKWCHVAPLMSRPKKETEERRVISDLTYPEKSSVNAFIIKNSVFGIEQEHSLPNIDGFVDALREVGNGAYMATIDIAHAYKNFRSDPLDWPLLCMRWRDQFYCEVAMPFGARASSYHMQRVALAIVSILHNRGVQAKMYLDDLIILSHSREKATRDYTIAQHLLADLGLPEAVDKAQPPAQAIRWLGVDIDAQQMSISMPTDKIQQVIQKVNAMAGRRSTTKHHLQSLLGLILHVSKCVRPARVFVGRLLEALRAIKGKYCNINAEMRADFAWFQEFLAAWNGVSVIPPSAPNKDILVDACLSGVGGG